MKQSPLETEHKRYDQAVKAWKSAKTDAAAERALRKLFTASKSLRLAQAEYAAQKHEGENA